VDEGSFCFVWLESRGVTNERRPVIEQASQRLNKQSACCIPHRTLLHHKTFQFLHHSHDNGDEDHISAPQQLLHGFQSSPFHRVKIYLVNERGVARRSGTPYSGLRQSLCCYVLTGPHGRCAVRSRWRGWGGRNTFCGWKWWWGGRVDVFSVLFADLESKMSRSGQVVISSSRGT
jgi:hypothetical protein